MAGVGWFPARPQSRVRRLLATGATGHATVGRMWRMVLFMRPRGGGGQHQPTVEIDVHPDGGTDYATSATGLLDEAHEAAVGPGTEVAIRYDPAHPMSVAVVGPLATSAHA